MTHQDSKSQSPLINANAGNLPKADDLIDAEKIVQAFYNGIPDPMIPGQQVEFGTSGHRGCSLDLSFNENHILAITQAICLYRKNQKISGPLFLGFDTHALSAPAFRAALEVLTANDITVMIAKNNEFTPTPVVSHAILGFNRGRTDGFADGIIITPSHNPPREGGFKYNPPHGGPAEQSITNWIQIEANGILRDKLNSVRRIPFSIVRNSNNVHEFDYLNSFVRDLGNVVDMKLIQDSKIKIGVDPLGGAGIHYWQPIADFYKINLSILNTEVDPTFKFVNVDWDGKIRMDPSSRYVMQSLIEKRQQYDIAFACDTDHDRHGIVTKQAGLLAPNDFFAVATDYLFTHRPEWSTKNEIGKSLATTELLNRVAKRLNRKVYETPVGFKWFAQGLLNGQIGFACEESAGASFLRHDGRVWTTDKDAFVPCLLAAEITARKDLDLAGYYEKLAQELGKPSYGRIEGFADATQKSLLKNIEREKIDLKELAGEKVTEIFFEAPGNGVKVGGAKIKTENAWLAVRPSGTEEIYKIYAESFLGDAHLKTVLEAAKKLVENIIKKKEIAK